MALGMAMLFCQFTTLVHTDISQQLLGGLTLNFVHFHAPQRLNPTDYDDPFTFTGAPPAGQSSLNFSCKKSQHGLVQHFLQTFMVP